MSMRIAIMTTVLAASSPAAAQTLEEALASAYRENPTIGAERARQRATKELAPQSLANALPQISGSAGYSKVDNTQTVNSTAFGGVGTSERTSKLESKTAAVEGQQVIFSGLRNFNAIRQARARVRAGAAQLASVEHDVLSRAAQAYFDVVRDEAVYQSTANNVNVLLKQKDEAALRFEVGEITKTDVAQADARLAFARAQLTTAQARLAVSRAGFAEVIGAAPATLEKSPPLPQTPATLEEAKAIAAELSPALIAAQENEVAARRGVAIAKGLFSPTVALTASYQYAEDPSTFVLNDEQFAYGARASIPLFTGGLNLSRVREAKALRDAAESRVEEASRRVDALVTSAFEQLQAARANIVSAQAQVDANRLALTGVRRESQLGVRTTLDVLDAEQEFLNAEVSLANAERDARVAAFQLLAAMGALELDSAAEPSLTND
jgi:outer membrane protein